MSDPRFPSHPTVSTEMPARQSTVPMPSRDEQRSLATQRKYYSSGALHHAYVTRQPPRPPTPWPTRKMLAKSLTASSPSTSSRQPALLSPSPAHRTVSLCSPSTSSPSTAYSPSIYYAETCVDDDEEDNQSYGDVVDIFDLPDAGSFKSISRPDSVVLPDDESDCSKNTARSRACLSCDTFEHRYIHYQVYLDGEGVPSKNLIPGGDPYLGRVITQRIAPPHTASSVKRYISKQEGIADPSCTQLFSTLSSTSPLEDGDHVPVMFSDGPGSTAEQPMALVILDPPMYRRFSDDFSPVSPVASRAPSWNASDQQRYASSVATADGHPYDGCSVNDIDDSMTVSSPLSQTTSPMSPISDEQSFIRRDGTDQYANFSLSSGDSDRESAISTSRSLPPSEPTSPPSPFMRRHTADQHATSSPSSRDSDRESVSPTSHSLASSKPPSPLSTTSPTSPVSGSPPPHNTTNPAPSPPTSRTRPKITISPVSGTSPMKITSPAVMHLMQAKAHPYTLKASKKYSGWPGYLSYKRGETLWADDLTVFDGRIRAVNKKGETGFVARRDIEVVQSKKVSGK